MRAALAAANALAIMAGLALGTGLRENPAAAGGAAQSVGGVPGFPEGDAPRFAFRRPFVVPVADDWRTQSLVVLTVELTLSPEDEASMGHEMEARLRDRIAEALFALGQEGALAVLPPTVEVEAAIAAAAAPLLNREPRAAVTSAQRRRV